MANAPDHAALAAIREETVDRYGTLPEEVETLFAVASLRITCRRVGVDEVSRFRDEIRVRPVDLGEATVDVLQQRVPRSSFHVATRTLNLPREGVEGPDLPGWVERSLLTVLGEEAPK